MTSTIPVNGDAKYKAAVKELAFRKRTSIAKLVRSALDTSYGKEIEECLFFAEDVASKQHSSNEVSNKHHTAT